MRDEPHLKMEAAAAALSNLSCWWSDHTSLQAHRASAHRREPLPFRSFGFDSRQDDESVGAITTVQKLKKKKDKKAF